MSFRKQAVRIYAVILLVGQIPYPIDLLCRVLLSI